MRPSLFTSEQPFTLRYKIYIDYIILSFLRRKVLRTLPRCEQRVQVIRHDEAYGLAEPVVPKGFRHRRHLVEAARVHSPL